MEQAPSDSLGWHDNKRYTYTNDVFGNAILVLYQIHSAKGWENWYKWENVYASTAVADEQAPAAGLMLSCTPNPFNESTRISFRIMDSVPVKLTVFNLKGQKVKTLAESILPGGAHSFGWNGRDALERKLPAGVYFVRLRVGGKEAAMRRVTLY
jgi:hypothetical protein